MVVELIYKLQSLHGLRISEVLNLKSSDIIGRNKLLIRGLKGSGNRIIVVEFIDELKDLSTHYNGLVFNGISRYFIYREYKKMGIGIAFNSSKKMAITHAPRHQYISELSNAGVNIVDIQHNLQHKSVSSTKHYESKGNHKR